MGEGIILDEGQMKRRAALGMGQGPWVGDSRVGAGGAGVGTCAWGSS